jgi:protein-S-isoprenylcysteine O-methyltransferase Ste14
MVTEGEGSTAGSRVVAGKAVAGLTSLLIILFLLIFMPVGTLFYWRGWGFFLSFSFSVIIITGYFMRTDIQFIASRVKAGPTAETRRSQQVIQAFAAVCFVLVVLVPGLDVRYGWSMVPWPVSVFGDVLVVLGLSIVFLVFRENRFASAAIEVGEEQRVIRTGPYGIVRHPMYSGATVMLVGIPLALGSWWGLLFVLLLVLVIVSRLLDEERFLSQHLSGYPEYRVKVRYRLIPYLW